MAGVTVTPTGIARIAARTLAMRSASVGVGSCHLTLIALGASSWIGFGTYRFAFGCASSDGFPTVSPDLSRTTLPVFANLRAASSLRWHGLQIRRLRLELLSRPSAVPQIRQTRGSLGYLHASHLDGGRFAPNAHSRLVPHWMQATGRLLNCRLSDNVRLAFSANTDRHGLHIRSTLPLAVTTIMARSSCPHGQTIGRFAVRCRSASARHTMQSLMGLL